MFDKLQEKVIELREIVNVMDDVISVVVPGYSDALVEVFRDRFWNTLEEVKQAYDAVEEELRDWSMQGFKRQSMTDEGTPFIA
jgi:hypothetical protein